MIETEKTKFNPTLSLQLNCPYLATDYWCRCGFFDTKTSRLEREEEDEPLPCGGTLRCGKWRGVENYLLFSLLTRNIRAGEALVHHGLNKATIKNG
ncbi:MAG: hypothetical protein ACFB2X_23350 [Rivularia sp. (in: cyanobacteria)]